MLRDSKKKTLSFRSLFLAILLAFAGTGQPNAGGFVLYLYQDGPNVVGTGSGEFDLSDYTPTGGGYVNASVDTAISTVVIGPVSQIESYNGFVGPEAFGNAPGALEFQTFSTRGDTVGIARTMGNAYELFLPSGYISNTPLFGTATWDHITLRDMSVTPGTYTWGGNEFTMYAGISPPIPEPPQYGFFIVFAVAGLIAVRRFKSASLNPAQRTL